MQKNKKTQTNHLRISKCIYLFCILMLNLFQIPAEDFEGPLHLALDHPSVKRYLLFNSNFFNFFLAPVRNPFLNH